MSADPPWVPDQTELATDLRELRRLLDQRMPRLTQIKELVRVARVLTPTSADDLNSVRAAVRLAVDHLPRDGRAAVAVLLYGLTDDSAGKQLTDRRELAYAKHVEMAPKPYKKTTFRTGFEAKLANDLATALEELVVAHNERPIPDAADQPAGTPEHDDLPQNDNGATATEQPETPVEAMPTLPEPDPESRPAHRKTPNDGRFPPGPTALLAILAFAVVGAALTLHVLDRGSNSADAVSGRCGPTTAQLLKNPQSEILVYAPNQEGWTFIINIPPNELEKNETFRYGEVRQFALNTTNETSETEHGLIARIGLPRSATLEPNSTCVYRNGDYISGARYAGTSLSAPSGVKIGSLAPRQRVYVTFKERLPTAGLTGNTATTYGAIASPSKIGGPEWIEKASHLELELIGGT
jgi:hypothetical protein